MTPPFLQEIDTVLVAVHGVRSRGEWVEPMFDRLRLDHRFDRTMLINADYPRILALWGWLTTWLPWTRHYLTNWMARQLTQVQHDYPGKPITVVSHSFGCWITHYALRRTPTLALRAHVMLGSVLHANDDLREIPEGRLGILVNNWSSNDEVARYAPPPFGHAGAMKLLSPLSVNSHNWLLGHTGYFDDPHCLDIVQEQLAGVLHA